MLGFMNMLYNTASILSVFQRSHLSMVITIYIEYGSDILKLESFKLYSSSSMDELAGYLTLDEPTRQQILSPGQSWFFFFDYNTSFIKADIEYHVSHDSFYSRPYYYYCYHFPLRVSDYSLLTPAQLLISWKLKMFRV